MLLMENFIEPLLVGCPYSQFRPPTIQFCEANLCSHVTQPANTLSNLAFFLVAYWIFFVKEKKFFFLSLSFSLISFLIGLFSATYHASFTFFMQFFDLSSMFLLAAFLLSINLYRLELFSYFMIYGSTFLLTLLSSLILIQFKSYGILIFFVLLLSVALSEICIKFQQVVTYKNYFISLGLFLFGFLIWCLDYFRIWCNPNQHFIQGHGIWHILCAVSIYFLYLFYTENWKQQ